MKVAVLGNTMEKLNLAYYLPPNTDSLICDDHPKGILESVKLYSNRTGVDYVCYKLGVEKSTDPDLLRYMGVKKGGTVDFPKNELTVYHSDRVVLFGYEDSLYTLFIVDLCERINKKLKIVKLFPTMKMSRDPE